MPTRAYRPVILLAALLAVLPLLHRGLTCGHDFDFHLLSWLEASAQFGRGTWPHWAYTPAFNAGEPRFIFYPPLSWALGGLLGLVLPWQFVPIAFTWLALALAGISFERLARLYTGGAGASLAATLYLANPYMLFTAYERTAFGELLAAAFIPLLLASALAHRVRVLAIAFPLALIWLTNAPAAVMASYALAVILAVRVTVQPRLPRGQVVVNAMIGVVLGLGLAAFYVVPAAYEQKFVQINMAVIEGMRPADHFLFHHMPGHTPDDAFHDQVVRTASIVSLGLLLGIAGSAVAVRGLRRFAKPPVPEDQIDLPSPMLPLGLLAAVIAFLLTPLSAPVWAHLPELKFLQFPWRLGALLGAILALFVAITLRRLRNSVIAGFVAPLVLSGVLIAPAWLVFRQDCDAEDALPARVALFHSNLGTEATDEYTPAGADPDALHPHDPPYWLIPESGQTGAPAPEPAAPGPAPDHLRLALAQPEYLVLNRRQYPAWEVRVNGVVTQPVTPERDDGLIAVALPAGVDTVDLRFRWMPDQEAGLLVSGLAMALVLGFRRFSAGRDTGSATRA